MKNNRKIEIVNACEKLYESFGFKDVTIKEIAEETTFSRPSIYNYFETKEEIFLELLKREYKKWCYSLSQIIEDNKSLSKEEYAKKIAQSLETRKNMLKLLSMNMYEIEANSRLENLTEFKKVFGKSLFLVEKSIEKFFPQLDEDYRTKFVYSFFPFMYGIYPYTMVTAKQQEAMKKAEVNYKFYTIYDITYNHILCMLNEGGNKI